MIVKKTVYMILCILCLTLLSGCANLEFEDWREAKNRLKNGVQFTEGYRAKLKGRYLFIQKNISGFKYGYDYGTGHIRIKFKRRF